MTLEPKFVKKERLTSMIILLILEDVVVIYFRYVEEHRDFLNDDREI